MDNLRKHLFKLPRKTLHQPFSFIYRIAVVVIVIIITREQAVPHLLSYASYNMAAAFITLNSNEAETGENTHIQYTHTHCAVRRKDWKIQLCSTSSEKTCRAGGRRRLTRGHGGTEVRMRSEGRGRARSFKKRNLVHQSEGRATGPFSFWILPL